MSIFESWIVHFAEFVPTPIKRPVILILDGASSHTSDTIDEIAHKHGVILIQIPPNTSHLFQPLDVSVFKSVKTHLDNDLYEYLSTRGKTIITKADAISLASGAWVKGTGEGTSNLQQGFRASGYIRCHYHE